MAFKLFRKRSIEELRKYQVVDIANQLIEMEGKAIQRKIVKMRAGVKLREKADKQLRLGNPEASYALTAKEATIEAEMVLIEDQLSLIRGAKRAALDPNFIRDYSLGMYGDDVLIGLEIFLENQESAT